VGIFYGSVAGKIDMAFANMATVLLFVRDAWMTSLKRPN
jgi:hypothetical protein